MTAATGAGLRSTAAHGAPPRRGGRRLDRDHRARARRQGLPEQPPGAGAEGLQPRRREPRPRVRREHGRLLHGPDDRRHVVDRRAVAGQPARLRAKAQTKPGTGFRRPRRHAAGASQPPADPRPDRRGDGQGRREDAAGTVDGRRDGGAGGRVDHGRHAGVRRRRRRLHPPRGGAHQAGARRPRHRRPDDPGLELPAELRLARRLDGRAADPRGRGRGARRRPRRRSRPHRACTATGCWASASATSRSRRARTPPTASRPART